MLVVYYSHAGLTASVMHKIADSLEDKGKVSIVELEYLHGRYNPIARVVFRAFPWIVRLEPTLNDLKDFDVLILGVSVLGGAPPPPVVKYLSLCKNVSHLKIICVYLYGLEFNAHKCIKTMVKYFSRIGINNSYTVLASWGVIQREESLEQLCLEIKSKLQPA